MGFSSGCHFIRREWKTTGFSEKGQHKVVKICFMCTKQDLEDVFTKLNLFLNNSNAKAFLKKKSAI